MAYPDVPRDPWVERREFLEYILKEYARLGGKIILPPQSQGYDPKLLDDVQPSYLIKLVRSGQTIDLVKCTYTHMPKTSNGGNLVRDPKASGPPVYHMTPSSSSTAISGSDNPFGSAAAGAQDPVANPFGPVPSDSGLQDNPFAARGGNSNRKPPTGSSTTGTSTGGAGGAASSAPTSKRTTRQDSIGGVAVKSGTAASTPSCALAAEVPSLDMPQLQTGLDPDQLADMAFTMAAASCSGPSERPLLDVLRRQLALEEAGAADILMVAKRMAPPQQQKGAPQQRSQQLEALLRQLQELRPADFGVSAQAPARFKHFVRWRRSVAAVLEACLSANFAEGYTAQDREPGRKLLARLRGGLRRLDVQDLDDFDEEEYAEAARGVVDAAKALTSCCRSGWQFPWAVRVRLAELLLGALFDTLDESSYVDEAPMLQAFLEQHVWPGLGVSRTLHLALAAWVHFRQYVVSGEYKVVRLLKGLIKQSAAESGSRLEASDHFGLGQEAVATDDMTADDKADRALAGEVGRRIIDFAAGRLADYHANFPRGEHMQGLLDVLVFAAQSRGDSRPQVDGLLLEAVSSSLLLRFSRLQAEAEGMEGEARLLRMMQLVQEALRTEEEYYTPLLAAHLTGTTAVAAARLYDLMGQALSPWLAKVTGLDGPVMQVFRAAMALDQEVWSRISKCQSAASGAMSQVVVDSLQQAKRWDLAAALQTAMNKWVSSQVENLATWVARQLQTEPWRPLGAREGYSASAVETARVIHDALEALFGMELPLHPSVVAGLMAGVDGCLAKYAKYVVDKLGSPGRLVPPLPPVTRFKKQVVVQQEADEMQSGKASLKKKGPTFLESVPRVEATPEFSSLQSLNSMVLSTMAISLHFLMLKTEAVEDMARQRMTALAGAGASGSEGGAAEGSLAGPLLASARSTLSSAIDHTTTFLATKITFWDMRMEWLELLYRHHVAPARIDNVLARLNSTLSEVCKAMAPDLQKGFARALLRASAQAYERVLLDGGPCRWFTVADVAMLEQDVLRLKSLFFADGEGLPRDDIESEMSRVQRLFVPMALQLGPLMDLVKEAKVKGSTSVPSPTGGPPIVLEEGVAMRLLARRPERPGSKVLKEKYKLGKKIK